MSRHRYTPEEIQFLKENIAGRRYADVAELFNEKFSRRGMKKVGASSMQSVAYKRGLHNEMSGICPHRKPIGSIRTHKGYVEIKIDHPNMWKRKHAIIWEKANGPIPKGHMIIFADGDKQNLKLDNLILVSRKEVVAMNQRNLIFPDAEKTKAGLMVVKLILLANERAGITRTNGKKRGASCKQTV
jgi:hypothetical protein